LRFAWPEVYESTIPNAMADQYDGPWKFGMDRFLPEVMLFLFPASHEEIDWSRSYKPLNVELFSILPDEVTTRYADALYQVWRKDGREQWVLLHFEVQSQPDPNLPRRMYVYSYRCFEKYKTEVFGYAVLGDDSPSFRPGPYVWELGKARMSYEYETAKLLDFKVEDLEASDNPAATILLAHRFTKDSKDDQVRRRRFKLRLTRLLFAKGYEQAEIRSLFDVLDWMLHLGQEQAIIYREEVLALREEPTMSTYVNTLESYFTQQGWQKGLQEGKQQGLQEGKNQGAERLLRSLLERRFGSLPSWVSAKLAAASAEILERWSLQLLDASSLDDVFV